MILFLYLSWFATTIGYALIFGYHFSDEAAVMVGLIAWVLFPIYFLPSFVAAHRHMVHRFPLLIGNLFFGVTVFGWAAVMVLAFMGKTDEDDPQAVNWPFR